VPAARPRRARGALAAVIGVAAMIAVEKLERGATYRFDVTVRC
jgi:hypothetical protein